MLMSENETEISEQKLNNISGGASSDSEKSSDELLDKVLKVVDRAQAQLDLLNQATAGIIHKI